MDFVNSKDNGTYLWNLAHFVSVLADNVIFCCGDLLPLLSSVTSRDYGQDVIEPCGGMTLETSFSFLNRLMSLVDVIVFTSSLAFSGVETNRNMSTGGFLRQCLRLGESNTDKMRNTATTTTTTATTRPLFALYIHTLIKLNKRQLQTACGCWW